MPGNDKARAAQGAAKARTEAASAETSSRPGAKRRRTPIAAGAFAKLQIERLERVLEGPIEQANAGVPSAVDRMFKILDRLDRYHGFSPPAPSAESPENARERILRKLSDVDARRAAAKGRA
jgi:hypothetical protein